MTIIKELAIHSGSIFHTKHGVHGNEYPESETYLYKNLLTHARNVILIRIDIFPTVSHMLCLYNLNVNETTVKLRFDI